MESLGNFIAWWEIIRDDADETIQQYEAGTLKLLRDGEDVSERAIAFLRTVSENMNAFITLAKREPKG